MRLTSWLSLLSNFAPRGISRSSQIKSRPRTSAGALRTLSSATEQLEDRSLLTVSTVFSVDTLTISLSVASDHAYISYDGARIDVGTSEGASDIYNGVDTITKLVVQDSGANATQIVTFSGSNTFTPITNITTTGIETAEVKQIIPISATVSGTASTVNVTAAGHIQDGLDLAAAGATVNVAAGTYTEILSISKNLSLVGNSPSDTFINGSSGVGVTIVGPAMAVTLQNLTISGTSTAVLNSAPATLTSTNVLTFDNGTTTTITGSGNSDSLRIVRNGSAILTYLGATLVNTRTYSAVTSLVVNGGAGDDTFTVDLTSGNPIPSGGITFNGEGDNGGGDKLVVTGGSTTTVTHSFINNNNGSVTLAGALAGTINYTGLEPITDNVSAVNRIFTFTGAAETISVTDMGGADGLTRIDSSLGEYVDFTAPTTSLTIITNGGDATTITSFDAAFNTPSIVLQDTTAASTFSLGASNVIPDATSLTVTGNAVFNLAGSSDAIDGLTGTGTVDNSAGASTLTVGSSGSGSTFSGVISNTGGTLGLTKMGAGTLILTNGSNSYSGATNINAGTLAVTVNNGLGTAVGNTVVEATGTLDLRGVTYSTAEPVTLNGGTLKTSTGTSSLAGAITLLADSFIDVTGTQLTLSGAITGGAGLDITKTGSGILILSNAGNTYAGATTVNAGTLYVNGTNSGTGGVAINNSAVLGGTGTIASAVTVNNTARLSPGVAGPGQLTVGSVSLVSTAFFDVNINGATAGTQYDQLVVTTGAVSLGSATMVPTIGGGYDPATFIRFAIINKTSGGAVAGTFSGHAEGTIYDVSSERLRVSYVESMAPYGDGNDVSLTVLPPAIVVTYTSNGNLLLTGSDFVDDIIVDFSNTNSVTLTGNGFTNFSGTGTNGQTAGPYLVTGTLTINTNGENDVIVLRGLTANATLDSGDININLGAGDDTLTTVKAVTPTLGLTMTGSLNVVGGLGIDTVRLGSDATNDTFSALNVSIDNGVGAGAQRIDLDRFTAHGNVTLTNSGTGAQTVNLGQNASNAPNAITGDLNIKQPSTATGYAVAIRNTSVNGLVSVINGSGTGAAATVTIDTTTAQVIGGTTSITNGNNVTNSVSLVGTTGGLRSVGNVTVKNGIATTSNGITVNSLGNSGTTSSTFTNGVSPANSITFSGTTGNAFTGQVAATNGLSTGTNAITATRLSSTKGLTLTNGDATTSNSLTVGGSPVTSLVSVTGNVTLANGASVSDSVTVDNLTVLGANAAGNLTLTNGATGAGGTTVTFGAGALNSISGNLQITNQASSGTRAVAVNRTTVSGRTGFNLYEVGGGNTTLTVGNNHLVTVSKALVIQDGTGNSTVTLQNLTVGSLNYTDIGGGVDTLDLGGTPAGTLTVNGVTHIDTGLGSDIVRTGGAGGSAVYNDSVFIALGSGNDSLTVGANASGAALSAANKFQFDGGAGDDTFAGSPLSLADYAPTTPLPKKVRSKITNFEHLS